MKNGKYELILAPKKFPGMKYRGKYAYEHVVVFWKWTKSIPGPGMEIHHKNGNYRDNRFCNLELISADEHKKLHAKLRTFPPIEAECDNCGKAIFIKRKLYRDKTNSGQVFFFCSPRCGALKQHAFGGKLR